MAEVAFSFGLDVSAVKGFNVKTHDQLVKRLMRRPGVRAEVQRIEREAAELLDALLKARQEAGLTQAQVAKRMGTQGPAIARLVAFSFSLGAAARSRVTASVSRIAEARAPHLPNRCDPPKADGEDCLRFLPGEGWEGTSSTAEQMRG